MRSNSPGSSAEIVSAARRKAATRYVGACERSKRKAIRFSASTGSMRSEPRVTLSGELTDGRFDELLQAGIHGSRLADKVHPADPPDLLRRPLPRPIWVHQPIATGLGQVIRCPNVDQVEHFKAARSQQPDPIAVPEVEFDARLVGPLEPMHPEVRA